MRLFPHPVFVAVGAWLACSAGAAGAALQLNRTPFEMTVAQVGERTVRLTLAPLDEQGRPRPDPASTVLVPFDAVEPAPTPRAATGTTPALR